MNVVHLRKPPPALNRYRSEEWERQQQVPIITGLDWVSEKPVTASVELEDAATLSDVIRRPEDMAADEWISMIRMQWAAFKEALVARISEAHSHDVEEITSTTPLTFAVVTTVTGHQSKTRLDTIIDEALREFKIDKYVNEYDVPYVITERTFNSKLAKTGWFYTFKTRTSQGI